MYICMYINKYYIITGISARRITQLAMRGLYRRASCVKMQMPPAKSLAELHQKTWMTREYPLVVEAPHLSLSLILAIPRAV